MIGNQDRQHSCREEIEEIDKEYELYFQQIEECETKEDLLISFGLHTARLNQIKKTYAEYFTEAKEHGADLSKTK